jgi:AraC-like DNA-binding protein
MQYVIVKLYCVHQNPSRNLPETGASISRARLGLPKLRFSRQRLIAPRSPQNSAFCRRESSMDVSNHPAARSGSDGARTAWISPTTRIASDIEPIDKIARDVGFGDKEQMRRAFLRLYGLPPHALRRATALRTRSATEVSRSSPECELRDFG